MIFVIGCLFFALRPFMIILADFMPNLYKRLFIFIFEYLAHLIVVLVLMLVLTRKKGIYKKIAISTGVELDGEVKYD